ncbi:MAG: tyrosine--tRNA ligase [Chloroflexi bacterium]|nr:tyrosine--tRNA ligase [Chloroflexota bacterium]
MPGFLPELRWRGQFHAASEGLEARLATRRPISAYNGFDPSGPWLHIGHLVPIFGLIRLQAHGGQPIVVVGGGTGMIGDPSGRSSERNLLSREQLEANVTSIRPQLERFLDFSGERGARLVNNLDWLEPIRLLDFLRDVGKHFTIPYMLAKDSVQVRLEGGLSFTEFSYMLIQATDFAHLYRTMGVELQMGGADQWGNITAGLELIRRTGAGAAGGGAGPGASAAASSEPDAFALAYPLLLNASGAKFGKSETGDSVWLHPGGTSPFAFYQHWLKTDDRDVSGYLRWFTTLPPDEIEALEAAVAERPEAREAQRTLAFDITARVHGSDVATAVAADSELLFGGEAIGDPAVFERLYPNVEGSFSIGAELAAAPLVVVLADRGVVASRGEARRLVEGGGIVVNGERVTDPAAVLPAPLGERWWEIRVGKRRRVIGRLDEGA